jgi:glycosyltransferase involved in cell wall biosynthesis
MATFDGARYVGAQAVSILAQLDEGDELVVSDDGSHDETVAIVRALGDPRIRILEATPSAARCATSSTPCGMRAAT